MTTFHLVILKCPACAALMTQYDLMSYTVHDSTSYSDGKCDSGAPSSKLICICPECTKPFWKEDGRYQDEPDHQQADQLPGAMDMYDLPWRFDDDNEEKRIGFYQDLLKDGFADGDKKEEYVRTMIWWAINDLVRNICSWTQARNIRQFKAITRHRRKFKALYKQYHSLFIENLDRMIFLFIKNGDPDLLFLAEMYREKGDFKKAREIYDKVEDPHLKFYRTLDGLIRKKVKKVVQL